MARRSRSRTRKHVFQRLSRQATPLARECPFRLQPLAPSHCQHKPEEIVSLNSVLPRERGKGVALLRLRDAGERPSKPKAPHPGHSSMRISACLDSMRNERGPAGRGQETTSYVKNRPRCSRGKAVLLYIERKFSRWGGYARTAEMFQTNLSGSKPHYFSNRFSRTCRVPFNEVSASGESSASLAAHSSLKTKSALSRTASDQLSETRR